ncbi:MAG: quinolinate synthase NadA [Nitrosopumilus sp.]|nr:quinolinate synthase NadA [Nitrosopumilus sp.]MDA7942661.1 quinolinate synthase NadA [Nitrosopumilus sp.]MDA7953773.1 quinolinate synthase NadA [Nitrosopumilus sp.]MDA7954873.1 quinolinate synthase NadA [Nitrosopumilus sp.]MDA7958918.1 quinolinate synthase NadA [Nitrosopumilus sp.]
MAARDGLAAEVRRLKEERDAVILAHNYQVPEVQDMADYVGDSLGLSRRAAGAPQSTIIFCGVHFMAETASIISPEKRVLIPDAEAGCSLSESVTAADVRAWKEEHPGAVTVGYVNTTAEVKAELDYCCTSSNAAAVVSSIPREKEVLFLPDMFLGSYVARVTGRSNIRIWAGECHVHAGITPAQVEEVMSGAGASELLVHPECGCTTPMMYDAASGGYGGRTVSILSTEGMMRRAAESPSRSFVVATETGILHRMRRQNPGKRFTPASEAAECQYMKMITPEKVRDSLLHGRHEVRVPAGIADRARAAITRMLEIG